MDLDGELEISSAKKSHLECRTWQISQSRTWAYPKIPQFMSVYHHFRSFPPLKLRQTQMQTTQVAGEFLMLKHLASNGKADPDAHLKRIKAGRLLAAQLAED